MHQNTETNKGQNKVTLPDKYGRLINDLVLFWIWGSQNGEYERLGLLG
jgi:hypothetical protein